MMEQDAEQIYFKESAWNYIRDAWKFKEQGRLAKAQQCLLEARYFEVKIHPKFIDRELSENIDRIGKLLTRGY